MGTVLGEDHPQMFEISELVIRRNGVANNHGGVSGFVANRGASKCRQVVACLQALNFITGVLRDLTSSPSVLLIGLECRSM